MFGMVDDVKPVEKALMTLSSGAITSQDSVNRNFVTIMVGSGASGHYFDNATTRDLKHRLQDYVYIATPRKILTAGRALLDGKVERGLQVII